MNNGSHRDITAAKSPEGDKNDRDKGNDGSITVYLVGSALAASFGSSFQYGYNLSVMTGILPFIQTFYNESHYHKTNEYLTDDNFRWLWATTISIFCVGGSCGALVAIYAANYLGRRGTLLLNSLISTLAAILMFISKYVNIYEILITGRWVIGVAVGIVIVTVPIYLSEISPVRYRGGISAFHQVGVSFGVLVGQIIGMYAFYSEVTWPFALLLNMFISWTGASVLYFCPESPRWILLNQSKSRRVKKAEECQVLLDDGTYKMETRHALRKLRGTDNVESEIEEMLQERIELEDSNEGTPSVFDLIKLKNPTWKWPLIISIVIITAQQLCGINSIVYYTTEIFLQAGLEENTVRIATVGIGIISSTTAVLTVLNVDNLGRRLFLLGSYSLMALATVFLSISLTLSGDTWSYMSIFFVYLYMLGFSPGPGAMTFVLLPELWSQGPRPAAMALAGQFNWWSNFIIGLAFPFMLNELGGYSFLIFTVILTITVIFTYYIVPETKHKTFTEIITRLNTTRQGYIEIDREMALQ